MLRLGLELLEMLHLQDMAYEKMWHTSQQQDTARTGTRGRFVFGMDTSTWLRRCSINGTDQRISLTKFAPMTGIATSCENKHRRPTSLGIWCHSGELRMSTDPSAGLPQHLCQVLDYCVALDNARATFAMAPMWSGVVPQQPPMMLAPASISSFTWDAMYSGVSRNTVLPSTTLGMPALA